MLQRIQTIYLLLVIICMIISLFLPFCSFLNYNNEIILGAFGLSNLPENLSEVSVRFPFYLCIFSVIGLTLYTISMYKNRKKQLLLGRINYLLILITIVFILIDIDYVAKQLDSLDNVHHGIGAFLPVAALPFVFLANRGIKKDEALVKSLDRLR